MYHHGTYTRRRQLSSKNCQAKGRCDLDRERAIGRDRSLTDESHDHSGYYPFEISKASVKHINCEHSTMFAISVHPLPPNTQSKTAVCGIQVWARNKETHTVCFVDCSFSFCLSFSHLYDREGKRESFCTLPDKSNLNKRAWAEVEKHTHITVWCDHRPHDAPVAHLITVSDVGVYWWCHCQRLYKF